MVRPVHNTEFCAFCNRLRVTSDGKLKPCLMRADNHIDIRGKRGKELGRPVPEGSCRTRTVLPVTAAVLSGSFFKWIYRMETAPVFVPIPPSSVVTLTFQRPVKFPGGIVTLPVIIVG